jgi:hypothetical protein
MNNARTFCLPAAAGTELASTSFAATVIIITADNALQRQCLRHIQILTRSGFRPLPNIPHCWLLYLSSNLIPVPMWLYILPNQLWIVSLVELLPHQLLNPTKADQAAIKSLFQ